MKIQLTKEQREKMRLVFETLDELKNDKKFMRLVNVVADLDFDVNKHVNDENEQDVMDIINFHDNLHDRCNHFSTY